jgi:cell division protein FtsA
MASAEAVLGSEEKELGVALIDLGAGTSDLLVFHRGALRHTVLLPVGGNHVTNDLADVLCTPPREAEVLKRRFGCADLRAVAVEEQVEVAGVGGRPARLVPRRQMCEVIEARIEEILLLLRQQLEKAGYDSGLSCGVVLTGGGAMLPGTLALAERVFQMPVRLGTPLAATGLPEVVSSPELSAGVGLVVIGAEPKGVARAAAGPGVFGRVRSRMAGWLREFF